MHLFPPSRDVGPEEPASQDRLRPARGLVVGLALGVVLWLFIITAWVMLR